MSLMVELCAELLIQVWMAQAKEGEQVAGFKDIHTGKIEKVMLIRTPADLESF